MKLNKYVALLEGGQIAPSAIVFGETLVNIVTRLHHRRLYNNNGPGSIADYGVRCGQVVVWSNGYVSQVSDLVKCHERY